MEFDDVVISRLFSDYVISREDKPRHTDKADLKVGVFDAFCTGAFPHNARLQNQLYEKMMNVAVEYEESGFIAGFKYAMTLISSQEQTEEELPQIPTPEEKITVQEAVNEAQNVMVDSIKGNCITSKQIAEMFEIRNSKVVHRIEKFILPYLDAESQSYFQKIECVNSQYKPMTVYKLNKAACQQYLKSVETMRKNFVNIAGGYIKMQELMEKVFPSEKKMVIA